LAVKNSQEAVIHMQTDWAIANYQLKDKAQEEAFIKLMVEADKYVKQYPSDASVLIWRGIILSTFAGVEGGLGALKYAKASKADLEKALGLQPDALDGGAYTSLGALYYKVPGWPISFGDDDKAQMLLEKGLSVSPAGIDSNYFYADFLIGEDHYKKAKEHLQRALNAAPRPGREVADEGRRKEIRAALAEVEDNL
jgi:tetratricopeptide (TPR) repeat protein